MDPKSKLLKVQMNPKENIENPEQILKKVKHEYNIKSLLRV